MSKPALNERLFFFDSLRVLAIFLMFVYHVSMIFVAEWSWHIKNAHLSNVLMEINYWLASFRMPLLFLVSAYISSVLLEKYQWHTFIGQRFNRLILPTIIWTFVLVAPQIYFERLLQGESFSYPEFYSSFLDLKWWPEGNFHWLHLWFIPYLFVYNVISIPVQRMLAGNNSPMHALGSIRPSLLISAFIIIASVPYTFLSVRYPVTYDLINDYARHSLYIFFVLAGLMLFNMPKLLKFIEERRQSFFRFAFLSTIAINTVRWNGWEPANLFENWFNHPITYCFIFLLTVSSWLWVFVFLGYGKKYLNKQNRVMAYCTRASYPFYILHQTVIVVIGYYVIQTNDDTVIKYMFLLFSCFFVTLLIYHLFIKPYKVVRFLFGCR